MSYVYVYLDPRFSGRYTIEDRSFLYKPFYIGKGMGKRDVMHYKGYGSSSLSMKDYLQSLVVAGVKPIILRIKDYLSEKQAYILEESVVSHLGRVIYNQGPLMNILEGGFDSAGMRGKNHSFVTKKRMRMAALGRNMTEVAKASKEVNRGKRKYTKEQCRDLGLKWVTESIRVEKIVDRNIQKLMLSLSIRKYKRNGLHDLMRSVGIYQTSQIHRLMCKVGIYRRPIKGVYT